MPATTNTLPALAGAERDSLSTAPRIVRSAVDASFLSREGVLTVVQAKPLGGTMTADRRVIRIPRVIGSPEARSERFTLLQKWDGVVLEVDAESFTARLLDSQGQMPPQQATFSRDEVSREEEPQIAVGAPFVWTIGYRHVGATRQRNSTMYFRRLPPWSSDEINAARKRAEKVRSAIGWK